MKKNFYKYLKKKQKLVQNYKENEKVIIENQSTVLKLISYFISFIVSSLKILIFIGIIIVLSIGATVICNKILNIDLTNLLGGKI